METKKASGVYAQWMTYMDLFSVQRIARDVLGETRNAEELATFVRLRENRGLVAMIGEKVVGFSVCRLMSDDQWRLLLLAVDEEHRRLGAGTALIERILKAMPKEGTLAVEIAQGNACAWDFFESQDVQSPRIRCLMIPDA